MNTIVWTIFIRDGALAHGPANKLKTGDKVLFETLLYFRKLNSCGVDITSSRSVARLRTELVCLSLDGVEGIETRRVS